MQTPNIKSITSVETTDRQSLNNIQSHSSHITKLENKISHATNYIRNRKQKLILSIKNVQNQQKNVAIINESRPSNPKMKLGCEVLANRFEERINRQKMIADLTVEQNKNLKEQNEYLLSQLRKMQMKQPKKKKIQQNVSKYKQLYESAQYQLHLKRLECEVYKNKADQIRRLTEIDMERLQNQILPFMKDSHVTNSTESEDHLKENLYCDD